MKIMEKLCDILGIALFIHLVSTLSSAQICNNTMPSNYRYNGNFIHLSSGGSQRSSRRCEWNLPMPKQKKFLLLLKINVLEGYEKQNKLILPDGSTLPKQTINSGDNPQCFTYSLPETAYDTCVQKLREAHCPIGHMGVASLPLRMIFRSFPSPEYGFHHRMNVNVSYDIHFCDDTISAPPKFRNADQQQLTIRTFLVPSKSNASALQFEVGMFLGINFVCIVGLTCLVYRVKRTSKKPAFQQTSGPKSFCANQNLQVLRAEYGDAPPHDVDKTFDSNSCVNENGHRYPKNQVPEKSIPVPTNFRTKYPLLSKYLRNQDMGQFDDISLESELSHSSPGLDYARNGNFLKGSSRSSLHRSSTSTSQTSSLFSNHSRSVIIDVDGNDAPNFQIKPNEKLPLILPHMRDHSQSSTSSTSTSSVSGFFNRLFADYSHINLGNEATKLYQPHVDECDASTSPSVEQYLNIAPGEDVIEVEANTKQPIGPPPYVFFPRFVEGVESSDDTTFQQTKCQSQPLKLSLTESNHTNSKLLPTSWQPDISCETMPNSFDDTESEVSVARFSNQSPQLRNLENETNSERNLLMEWLICVVLIALASLLELKCLSAKRKSSLIRLLQTSSVKDGRKHSVIGSILAMISRRNRNENASISREAIPTINDKRHHDFIAEKHLNTKRSASSFISDEMELFPARFAVSTTPDLDGEICIRSSTFETIKKGSDKVLRVPKAHGLVENSSEQTIATDNSIKSFADKLVGKALTELTAALNRSLREDNNSSPNLLSENEVRYRSSASESSTDINSSAIDERAFAKSTSAFNGHKSYAEKLIVEALAELTEALQQQMEVRTSGRDSSVGTVPEETSERAESPFSDLSVAEQPHKSCKPQNVTPFNCPVLSIHEQMETAHVESDKETNLPQHFSAESRKDSVSFAVPEDSKIGKTDFFSSSGNSFKDTDPDNVREQTEEPSTVAARWRTLVDKLVRPSAEILFAKVVDQIRQLRFVSPFADSKLSKPPSVTVSKINSQPDPQNTVNDLNQVDLVETPFSNTIGRDGLSSIERKPLTSSQSDSKLLVKPTRHFHIARGENNTLSDSVVGTTPRISTSQTTYNTSSMYDYVQSVSNRSAVSGMREREPALFHNSAIKNKQLLDSQNSFNIRLMNSVTNLRLSRVKTLSGSVSESKILHQPTAFGPIKSYRVLPNIKE